MKRLLRKVQKLLITAGCVKAIKQVAEDETNMAKKANTILKMTEYTSIKPL